MDAVVPVVSSAVAIPEPAGHGVGRTGGEVLAVNVELWVCDVAAGGPAKAAGGQSQQQGEQQRV